MGLLLTHHSKTDAWQRRFAPPHAPFKADVTKYRRAVGTVEPEVNQWISYQASVAMSARLRASAWLCIFFAVGSVLIGGCSLSIIPRADSNEPLATESGVLVFGKVTYIIDGETKLPYGAFRPSIPAPHLDLLQLENGNPFQSHGVSSADGGYMWRMQPGHYVITDIGQGQFIDDYRITWPRLAFEVKAGGAPIYLGNLQLIGKRYAEPYTLSTGTKGLSKGIRYEFLVVDELSQASLPFGRPPDKSLVFYRPNMPIGEQLVARWRISRDQVIKEIFGP